MGDSLIIYVDNGKIILEPYGVNNIFIGETPNNIVTFNVFNFSEYSIIKLNELLEKAKKQQSQNKQRDK